MRRPHASRCKPSKMRGLLVAVATLALALSSAPAMASTSQAMPAGQADIQPKQSAKDNSRLGAQSLTLERGDCTFYRDTGGFFYTDGFICHMGGFATALEAGTVARGWEQSESNVTVSWFEQDGLSGDYYAVMEAKD